MTTMTRSGWREEFHHGLSELEEKFAITLTPITFRSILSQKSSRNLFFFLLLNLSFAFVELFYGMWMNR